MVYMLLNVWALHKIWPAQALANLFELSLFTGNIFQPDIHCLETPLERGCSEIAWFCLPFSFAPGSISASNYFLE